MNLALTRLGVPRIISLTDGTQAALCASAIWETVRDEVLAKHPWNRTTGRADLRRVTDGPKLISSITAAADALVTTTKPHGYQVNQTILILGVEGCLDSHNVSMVNGFFHTVLTVPSSVSYTVAVDTTLPNTTAYIGQGLSLRIRTKRISEAVATLAGATQALPCVVTTALPHGLINGEQIYIDGMTAGMTDLNGRYYLVGNVPTTTSLQLMGVDSTLYTPWTAGGSIYRVLGEFVDWDYQYTLPYDCLRVLNISDDDGNWDWNVEDGSVLVCDFGPDIAIRYCRRIVDATVYEPLLVNALTARLAAEMANELTRNATLKQELLAEYMGFLEEAKLADLREQTPEEIEDGTWITGRWR